MLKVQQIKQNQFFLEEAGAYLEANGYTRSASHINGSVRFEKDDTAVLVYGDNVDFLIWDDGEPGERKPGFSRYMALTNIADLDLFKWMLLFHIADIVPMQQFITKARKEVPAQVNEVFVQIFDHFRITENQNAVPIGY